MTYGATVVPCVSTTLPEQPAIVTHSGHGEPPEKAGATLGSAVDLPVRRNAERLVNLSVMLCLALSVAVVVVGTGHWSCSVVVAAGVA